MTDDNWEPNSPTVDVLQKIIELARESSRTPGAENDNQKTRDSQRMAKITMQMAMSALEASETQQDPIESMIMHKIAEEKERRKAERAREKARIEQELRDRDKYWEAEVERVRKSIEKRMTEERELECEWQEAKYEAKRKQDEADQRSIEQAAADAVKRAQQMLSKEQKKVELAYQEALEAKKEADRQRERAERAERAEETLNEQLAKEKASCRLLQDRQESVAWRRYESQWRLFKRISCIAPDGKAVFRFEDVPWPTVVPPDSPSAITPQELAGFLFSGPPLEQGMSLKSRIKECLLRWHPDKFSGRWMKYIVDSDRERVRQGIDAVACAGNQVLSEYSSQKQLTN